MSHPGNIQCSVTLMVALKDNAGRGISYSCDDVYLDISQADVGQICKLRHGRCSLKLRLLDLLPGDSEKVT